MAEKPESKPMNKKIIIAIAAVIVIVVVGLGIYKVIQSNNWKSAQNIEDIVIKESDSDEVKIEKMQAKIELINKDIDKIQENLNTELEKMNSLYEEYVSVMNEYQTGVPATEEDMAE